MNKKQVRLIFEDQSFLFYTFEYMELQTTGLIVLF